MDYVIIVAAGSGQRLGADAPKALVEIAGAPLVTWSLRAIASCSRIAGVVIAAPLGHVAQIEAAVPTDMPILVKVVAGGASRQRSVAAALAAVPSDAARIAVHDAARPLVTAAVFDAVFGALDAAAAAVVASRVADTIKRAGPDGVITGTVDRSELWRAETPQAFRAPVLRDIYTTVRDDELDAATDDASLAEARGIDVVLVDAGVPNLKVTTPADVRIAASLLGDDR